MTRDLALPQILRDLQERPRHTAIDDRPTVLRFGPRLALTVSECQRAGGSRPVVTATPRPSDDDMPAGSTYVGAFYAWPSSAERVKRPPLRGRAGVRSTTIEERLP